MLPALAAFALVSIVASGGPAPPKRPAPAPVRTLESRACVDTASRVCPVRRHAFAGGQGRVILVADA